MLTLLTVLILMNIIHNHRLRMYWSKDSILAIPIFNQVTRRNRFLLRFLHFADNTQYNPADPDRDKLYKLRSIINMIKDRCCRVYSPGKCLSMDESLVLFKGRLSFKQYISSKRARFGIKCINCVQQMVYIWSSLSTMEILCQSKNNGRWLHSSLREFL